MRMVTVGLAGLVILASWAGLSMRLLDSTSLGLTLAVMIGGPWLIAGMFGLVVGMSVKSAGTRAGAAAGLIVGLLTQAWAIWLRSTETFLTWAESVSRTLSSVAGDGQVVVSVSTSPSVGGSILSIIMLIAVGFVGGWIADKIRSRGPAKGAT